jgi:glycerol-3-phosphate dehydrogenase (NAD(P)+)
MRIAVIGAGSWGTALSMVAGRAGHEVRLWSRNDLVVEQINRDRVNSLYLAPHKLPAQVSAMREAELALHEAEIVLLSSPSHAVREVLESVKPFVDEKMIFVSAAKGIENVTGMRVSQIVSDVLSPMIARPRFVCLSGPSFAREVAEGQPTAVVAASADEDLSRVVQQAMSAQNFRVYTNNDVVGTELGGAVKNVIALAAGMLAGLGLGWNSVAALITRGLSEMSRVALSEGGRIETLMGLAGLGDLVLTCTGALSRNRFVGQELGKGRKLNEVLDGMKEVAEGVRTTRSVKQLGERAKVDMPITAEVHAVLYEEKSVTEAVESLMARPLRGE